MSNGEATREVDSRSAAGVGSCLTSSADSATLSVPSVAPDDDGEDSSSAPQNPEKDPRKFARKYQLELCKKALEENIIVYLGTGCGKTHIAVLLIYELRHLIRSPQKRVCVFLAPTVALVHQQAKVIEDTIDFKVGIYCGSSKHLKKHYNWEKEIEHYEVLVMTPQILLHNLSHCFIKMEFIALLIFDECHHAQVNSSHPYAQIMKVFYKSNDGKLPRIFGMTASPVVGKGASSQTSLPKSINSLEGLLDAKVYSVEDKEQLEQFVASPVVRVYQYGPVANSTLSPYLTYSVKLEEMKRQCISELGKSEDHQSLKSLQSTKKLLSRMHDNIKFCLENLGLHGALQACQILLSNDQSERNALIEAEGNISNGTICARYLAQAAKNFAADCTNGGIASDLTSVEFLKEPFFSKKLLRLIGILSTYRSQPNAKCIIFVNRIVVAKSISYILQNLKFLTSWKCDFLVGVHSGLKSMSRKTMKSILEKFQNGKLNLLVATKVGEEGLDIQTCCLVIRFDLPETVSSFIQSRGRARMPQSEYAFLVDSGSQKELDLIESFKKNEGRMNIEISFRTSDETFASLEERVYKVDTSGACISSGYSVSLLQHYCSKLPHDEYFHPKPKFFYFDDLGGTVCQIILPSNAPIHQIVSSPLLSAEAAKKDACLKAIEQLHKVGALNKFLLPDQEELDEESVVVTFDSECYEDEGSRGELHEMLVPTALKESWSSSDDSVYLFSYSIQFYPDPKDRIYKKFGLFVKRPLPQEAVEMELDLHLARGRSVRTKLVPSEHVAFNKDEIMEAQNFQEMFLKIILDRSEFTTGFVPLGKNTCESSPTFYLLLPIIHGYGNEVMVDWKTVRRCLSSPIFWGPTDVTKKKVLPSDAHLQLANGCRRINDIENSLVYTPYQQKFYCVTNVVPEKNAYWPHKGSSGPSHVEHFTMFGINLKHPKQLLLRAKPLFFLRNLLHNRKQENSESQEMDEYFIDLVPELCELKIIGFSKDIGSSISLLPSLMHRLENLLVAVELKCLLSASFSEGAEISASRVLEALTTERCQERLSLERLEILGDAFLKFAVGRHLFLLHDTLDEGELTRKRSNAVNNSNLFKLACRANLQVYIRDQPFDPCQFFALGHPCPRICTRELEGTIHSQHGSHAALAYGSEVRCSKGHHWLHKKTIADVVEALVGAFIVDSGFKAATAFLRWIGIKVDFEASQVINVCQASSAYMPLTLSMDLDAIENILGYRFVHRGLLLQAFVHPSYNKHGGGCYQRLEFLGDAVLDYLIISYLFSVYPKLKPGHLTDLRSALVNNKAFANIAVDKSFHQFLFSDSSFLSEAVKDYVDFVKTPILERNSLEEPKCPKVLGDLIESCLGAILLDSGFDLHCIWKIMLFFLDPIMNFSNVQINPFRQLQEFCQSHNWELKFSALKKGRNFLVEANVNGKDVSLAASVSNSSRKEATKIASEQVFAQLKDHGYAPQFNYLEETLRSISKMEPKLIGYDETPVDVIVPDASQPENLNVQESFDRNFNPRICSMSKMINSCSSSSVAINEDPLSSETPSDPTYDMVSQTTGGLQHRSARSRLYEVCTANCWKTPLFECCHEEGPGHLKSFTCKVVVEIEAASNMIVECYGASRTKKKAAAEHAAEGALWYLNQEGYLL